MQQNSEGQGQAPDCKPDEGDQAGLYVYCVVPSGEEVSLGEIGIENHAVYTVAHEGICALVHDCLARPYQSENGSDVAACVLAHHQVVDTAWKRWGGVLSLTFNTIIRARNESSASENLTTWLKTEQASLKGRLDVLKGKAEYGVQVSWDPVVIAKQIAAESPEIKNLEEEIRSKPRGVAYMYRQKLERLLKRDLEAAASQEFRVLYGRLGIVVDNVHVEKGKTVSEGRQMIMNLSCLVSTEKYPDFKSELDRISARPGFLVRLVGPLPPYSFY